MKVQLMSVDLIGGGRRVSFEPGLNIVTGPITTGKTTFLRLCRALLNTGLYLHDFPREARHNVVAVAGEVQIVGSLYSIVRPLVSTETAKVDIAGLTKAWRLPTDRPDRISQITYGQWRLRVLGLPELRVPSAPSQPASEPTPVTINDYFLYCRLTQTEIDSSVFAHLDSFKNIKRRYVFEIIYGLYDPEMAALQEQLRLVSAAIRQLSTQSEAFQRFLEGTPWANRATLVRDLERARRELSDLEAGSVSLASSASDSGQADDLRQRLRAAEDAREQQLTRLGRERASIEQLGQLLAQLESQIGKLTRSIVADSYLHDLEFLICPRCGTPVDVERAEGELCGLCLQVPTSQQIDRAVLIAEQERLGLQVQETRELIRSREEDAARLEQETSRLDRERQATSQELDFVSLAFVSASASEIASLAARRAATKARIDQLEDYVGLLAGLDRALGDLAALQERRQELEAQLDAAATRTERAQQRIERLEFEFANLVERFRLPRLEGPGDVRIDRRTYLPLLYGRRFGELSSQGLQVLVNVAHALAHHRTSIALDLGLPQILFIDGLTSNLGHEGEDLRRSMRCTTT